jgi:hypothetical protein
MPLLAERRSNAGNLNDSGSGNSGSANRLKVLILALSRFVCIDPRLRDKDPWI